MDKNLVRLTEDKQIDDVVYSGVDKVVRNVRFGMIRIAGEKTLRRVSGATLNKLKTLPKDFTGKIEISELGLMIPVNQIVFMEEREEQVVERTDFTNLPTTNVFLTWELKPIYGNPNRVTLERMRIPYVEAIVHFEKRDEDILYYLNPLEKIKRAVFMKPQPDGYPHAVCRVVEYGRELDITNNEWK